ncbi:hypothetical protein OM076_15985 [Solirubrobacter ginsenosidimutans]|uniref:Uncharacterized protein n=1 Tax=Solirubrobacter ginsenosidimutans TaxID=490573 RepID=A0A9X3S0X6_9ACTN|nr:hypothetical protein [Solirubrobacter ginsenosidimutans]
MTRRPKPAEGDPDVAADRLLGEQVAHGVTIEVTGWFSAKARTEAGMG